MKGITYTLALFLIVMFLIPNIVDASNINATLQGVKGEVVVTKGGGKKEIKAFNGMRVDQGDSLRTGSKSSVKIVFNNKNEATLSSNAKVTIAKLASESGGDQAVVKQQSGGLWNKIKSIFNAGDRYEIETSTSVMGVRGTLFYTLLDPEAEEEGSQVRVLDGQVAVKRTQGQPNDREQVVNLNQELSVGANETESKEPAGLDIKKFVEKLDADLFVTVIDDALEVAEETEKVAQEQQENFKETKNKDQALASLVNANRAALLANLSNEIVREVEQSPRKQEFEQALQDRGKNIQDVQQKATNIKVETEKTRKQISETVEASGVVSKEEKEKINAPVEEQIKESENRQQEATQAPSSSGGGSSSTPSTPSDPNRTEPEPTEPELSVTTTDHTTAAETVVVSGTATEGSTVKVFRAEIELASTEVTDGTFSIEVSLIEGENILEVIATNSDGSTSEIVTVVRKTIELGINGPDHIIVPFDTTSQIQYHVFYQYGHELSTEDIQWEIISDEVPGVSLNNVGLLEISSEVTTGDTITIKATLVNNQEISATIDVILIDVTSIDSEMRSISGDLRLEEPAPETGLTVVVQAMPIFNPDYRFFYQHHHITEVYFSDGEATASFSLDLPIADYIDGYKLSYHIYRNYYNEYQMNSLNYLKNGFYSEDGTTLSFQEATTLLFNGENLTDIDIDINTGKLIQGTITIEGLEYFGNNEYIHLVAFPHYDDGGYNEYSIWENIWLNSPYNREQISEDEYKFSYTLVAPWDHNLFKIMLHYHRYSNGEYDSTELYYLTTDGLFTKNEQEAITIDIGELTENNLRLVINTLD